MELSWLLAQSIFSMALMIMVGFAVGKKKVVPPEASKSLSALTLYVLAPCCIFSSYQIEFTKEKLIGLGIGALAAILVHVIYIPFAYLLGRFMPISRIERASIIYSNAGNLIIPLVGFVLGDEYVFYTSAYVTVQVILLWTHGVTLISDKAQMNFRKIITNPSVISIFLGLAFFVFPISLPSVLETTVEKLGAMIGPVSMIGIGLIMSTLKLREVFASARGYLMAFLRLIVFPVIIIIAVRLTGITFALPEFRLVLFVTVLAAAAPTAVSVQQQASVFGEDAASAGVINVMTTVLCIITMPLVMMFYQLLCW